MVGIRSSNHYISGQILQGRPRHLPWSKMFMIRMLTRDLFAAANVLVITRQLHSMQSAILFKQFCPPVRHILYVNERG